MCPKIVPDLEPVDPGGYQSLESPEEPEEKTKPEDPGGYQFLEGSEEPEEKTEPEDPGGYQFLEGSEDTRPGTEATTEAKIVENTTTKGFGYQEMMRHFIAHFTARGVTVGFGQKDQYLGEPEIENPKHEDISDKDYRDEDIPDEDNKDSLNEGIDSPKP